MGKPVACVGEFGENSQSVLVGWLGTHHRPWVTVQQRPRV
jgi:hypothetical protein